MTTISRPTSIGTEAVPARRKGGLASLSVVLLIVGLAGGFFVGRVTKADTVLPSDLANSSVTKLLSDFQKALNRGDASKIATFFATDARFIEVQSGDTIRGNTKIAEVFSSWQSAGFRSYGVGTAVQHGALVTQYTDASVGSGMAVFQIESGKIKNFWIVLPSL